MLGYKKDYTEEVQNIINNKKLNKNQEIILNNILKEMGKEHYLYVVFPDMYKLYLSDFSTNEIAGIYKKSYRTIQLILKKYGLNRTKHEAQKIAVKKRNYVEIREKAKMTAINRQTDNLINGSNIEQYARTYINISLNSKIKQYKGQAIIGLNTVTTAGELDIPIIILINDMVYKYGVEIDGAYYHNEEKDNNKAAKFNDIGYKIYNLYTKAYCNTNNEIIYKKELINKLDDIVLDIINNII